MQKIYSIIYYILIFFLSVVITTIWLSYFVKRPALLLIFSSITAFLICIIIYKTKKKKMIQNKITKDDENNIKILSNYFLLSDNITILNFLKLYIPNTLISKNKTYLLSLDNTSIYHLAFKFQKIDKYYISEIIKNYNNKYKEINIICFDYDTEIELILNNYKLSNNIKLLTINNVYKSYLQNKSIDFKLLDMEKHNTNKYDFKTIINTILNPSNWTKYMLAGFIILCFSITNSNKIYYFIISSLLWILGIICLSKKLFLYKNK